MATLDGPRWGPKSGGAPRQLVVLCHGLGADGHDLIDIAPDWGIALPDAMFAAPDAPEPCEGMPFGRQWFALWDRSPTQLQAGVAAGAAALISFIDAELARLHLPPDAVALMGFSQGAMTALYAGLCRPVKPRAVLAYAGALLAPVPATGGPFPPMLLVHGEDDAVVPAAASHDAGEKLRMAGVPVESLFLPGLGHGLDATGISTGALFLQRWACHAA